MSYIDTAGTVQVVLKFGSGYDAPWVTVKGTPDEIRDMVAAVFDVDPEGLSTADVVVNASRSGQAAWGVASKLGGKVRPTGGGTRQRTGGSEDAVAAAYANGAAKPAAAVANPVADLVAAIGGTNTKEELAVLWVGNKELFSDAAVKAAAAEAQARFKK